MPAPLCHQKTASISLWWALKLPNMGNQSYSIWDNTFGIDLWNFILLRWAKWFFFYILIALQHHMWAKATEWEQAVRGQRDSHSLAHTTFSRFFIFFNTSDFRRPNCEDSIEMGLTELFNRSNNIFQHVACKLPKWVVCCISPACTMPGCVVVQSKWQSDEIA